MFTTAYVILVASVLLAANIAIQIVVIRRCLRWRREAEVLIHRIIATLALQMAAHGVLWALTPVGVRNNGILPILVSSIIIQCMIMTWVLRIRTSTAFLTWFCNACVSAVFLAIVVLLIKPYFLEVYQVPTNSMAPTILGRHSVGTCPECGANCYRPAPLQLQSWPDPLTICDNYHETEGTITSIEAFEGDRILSVPFLAPNRWDIITFEYPEDREVSYVKRLVGLPGETIEISDGRIFANGQELEVPHEIKDLKFTINMETLNETVWGTAENKATLKKDEYFVLGDFQARARDSRLWQRGAAGRSPFAVPASHLKGVVTHIVWPPSRWRILRH